MVKFSFVLEDEKVEGFRAILEELGCVSKRGPLAGQGSPQPLIDGIADGDLIVTRIPKRLPEETKAL
jgi:hypothetical protein